MFNRFGKKAITLIIALLLICGFGIVDVDKAYAATYQNIVTNMTFSTSIVNYNNPVNVTVYTSCSEELSQSATLYLEGYNGSVYSQIQVYLTQQSAGVYTGVANPSVGHIGYEFYPSWLEIKGVSGTEYWDYTIANRLPGAKFKVYRDWESELQENVTVAPGGATTIEINIPKISSYDYSKPLITAEIADNTIADVSSAGYGFGEDNCFVSLYIQGITTGGTRVTIKDINGSLCRILQVTVPSPETEYQTICVGETVSVPVEYNSSGLKYNFSQTISYGDGMIDVEESHFPSSSQVVSVNSNYLPHNQGTFTVPVYTTGNYYLNLFDGSMNRVKSVYLTVQDHQYSSEIIQQKTCQHHEIIEYTCVNCGTKMRQEGSEYGEHQWNTYYTVDKYADCTKEGSKSIHCSLCNTINENTVTVIPANGHTPSDPERENIISPSCENNGSYDEVVYCSVCKEELSREEKIIEAEGHKWNDQYTVDKPATCSEKGSKSYHCSVCESIKPGSSVEIDMVSHEYDGWEITKNATCTRDGSKQKVCKNCGNTITEVIPAEGHDWNSGKTTEKATCTEDGIKTFTCNVCGDTREEAIPALGHNWDEEYTIDREPTCTVEGEKSIHCVRCDRRKTSSIETIPIKNHKYGEWSISKKPTCTEDGCNERTCINCGDKETESIPATGIHTYDDWKTVTEPTYNREGLRERTCTMCGHTDQEVIPMTDRLSIQESVIKGIKTKVYTGKALTQNPSVTLDNKVLLEGEDYKLTYSNNKNVGMATIKISGINGYTGSVSKTFRINPKATTMVSASALSKGFTAKWKKQATQTTGYQLQYSTSSTFKTGNKLVTISKNSTLTKKVTKLKAKKKYYVRVRTYKTVNGTKYFSAWSTKRAVTTKK